jgi:hypothetical protein
MAAVRCGWAGAEASSPLLGAPTPFVGQVVRGKSASGPKAGPRRGMPASAAAASNAGELALFRAGGITPAGHGTYIL